ncbi:SDR family NAD(P)-dependent oxidoreductase [Streptomyces sp. NPDC048362]|uniref:SDR family NAD(P)-dependent oxidoreductase n=1 Tax=Streptomyces sp. NPDC048362 TaxID=3365539 RepID=UPI003721BF7D
MNDPIECHLSLPHDDFIMQNHRIHEVSVMPGATFLDIVYRILGAQSVDTEHAVLRDVLFAEPIATAPGRDLAVRVTIGAPDATGARHVDASGAVMAPGAEPARAASGDVRWRPHFSARLEFTHEPPPPPIDPRALLTRAERTRDMAELYHQARAEDIRHGPPMMGFGALHVLDTGGLLARLELDPGSREHEGAFHLHPAKLDAATLVTFGHRPPPGPDPFIPVYIEEFRAPRGATGPCWVYVPTPETLAPSGDVMHNDCLIYDEQGRFVAKFTKLSCKRVRHAGLITRLLDAPAIATEPRSAREPARSEARFGQQPAPVEPRFEQRPTTATAAGDAAASATEDTERRLVTHVRALIGGLLGREAEAVDPHRGFYELGLDSVALLAVSAELEKVVDGRLYPTLLFEHTDVASVARHLARKHTITLPAVEPAPGPTPPTGATAPSHGERPVPPTATADAAPGERPAPPTEAPGPAPARRSVPPAEATTPSVPEHPPATEPAVHRPCWTARPARPARDPRALGDLLVVTTDPALPGALRSRSAPGRRTVHVLRADTFERTGPDTWRLPTASPADFTRLLDELAAAGTAPTVLAVCPDAAPGPSCDTGDGYDVVWALAGALATRSADDTRQLRFLYSADREDLVPQHTAVGALARGITAENPALRCRSTLVVGAPDAAELADVLLAEAADESEDSESRYRHGAGGERSVRRLTAHALADRTDAAALPRGAVCLITGGAGGIGSLLAEHLATTYGARLVLCGRRPLDDTVSGLLDRCAAHGGEAHYVRADITHREGAEAAAARCRELFGRIDAVFHCAGRTDDALHFRRRPAETRAVLAPKLDGTLHLDRATADCDPSLFVLFSSLSAVLPNTGQCAYGYANAFLDAFAERRTADPGRTGRTLALAWPYWADGGMRADAASLARSAALGMRPLPTALALRLLDRCLAQPEGPARLVAVHTDLRPGTPVDDTGAPGPLRSGLFAPVGEVGEGGEVREVAEVEAAERLSREQEPAPGRGRTRSASEPVAIIGVAGRYPQAPDLETFWANLAAGRDCVTEVPPDRWDHEALFDPEVGRPGRTYGRWGGFLAGMDRFDPLFFGISRREAERMDPQERLFLTIAWQTLEDAGYPPQALAGEPVGVFAGVMWNHFQFVADPDDETAPVALHSSVANRVSYAFDFCGPSLAVDTACSSSLTAVQLAVESVRRGESRLALAGGVNLMTHPQKYLQLARGRWLSRDGRCRAFGAGGTGYVPGEGVGAVLLKPLDQALADGDHIHAVIRSARLNHSGRTSGFTVPSPAAQASLVADAVRDSGADVRALGYVEAHGTGTALGDPIELEGLRTALATFEPGPHQVAIGSVKSNIGHLESAAGIAGLTKVLLQFRHGALAPSLHAETLNPHLDFGDGRLTVQRTAAPWPRPAGGRRLAGLSAFGAGGSNAHLVLEEAPEAPPRPAPRGPRLFVLSAKDDEALRERASALLGLLTPHEERSGGTPAPGTNLRPPHGTGVSTPYTLVRSLAARRLVVPESSLGGGETFEDLGFDPAALLALAHDLAEHHGPGAPAAGDFTEAVHPGTTLDEAADIWAGLEATAGTDDHGLPRPDDLAYTLRVGRTAMPVRFAVVADDLPGLRAALERLVKGADPGPREYRGTATHATEPADGAPDSAATPVGATLEEWARRWVAGETEARWPEPGTGRARPRRIPLPGYPFREERCWPGGWTGAAPEPDRRPAPPATPTTADDTGVPAADTAVPSADTVAPVAATAASAVEPTVGGALLPPDPVAAVATPRTATARDSGAELVVLDGGIGLIRMGSPMFTERLLRDLRDAFDTVSAREDVKAVVITGADGVFSMGGTSEALDTLAGGAGRFTDQPFVYEGLLRCDRPVVAAIEGHASGGGLAFGLYADVVLLAEESVYSANFVTYGFTPGMGATYVLERRFGSALADEMMLTGRSLTGAELRRYGAMVTVLPRREVLPAALERARALAAQPREAVRRLKQELAGRVLGRLDEVVGREVLMHEEVLGAEARDRVKNHFARVEAFRGDGPRPASGRGPGAEDLETGVQDRSPRPRVVSSESPTESEPQHVAESEPVVGSEPVAASVSMVSSESTPEPEVAPVIPPPSAAGPSPEEVRADVVASLSQVLYLRPEEIDDERTFAEMGLDSIGAVEVVRDLNERHGAGLEAVAVYDHPTVPAMTAALLAARDRSAALHRAALDAPASALATPVSLADVGAAAPGGKRSDLPREAVAPPSDAPRSDRSRGGTTPAPVPERTASPAPVVTPSPHASAPRKSPVSAASTPVVAGMVTLRQVSRRAPAAARTVQTDEEPDGESDPAPPRPAVAPCRTPEPPQVPDGPTAHDIAVIGMSGRFPGAEDLDAFWENLKSGRSEITEVPAERWDPDRWYHPDRSVTDRTDSKWAALISGVDEFDPAFFRLSPLEAEAMEPQQRLFLQEAWKALEDAGYGSGATDRPTERGSRDCGVFVGCGTGDYDELLTAAGQSDTSHAFLGSAPSVLAARISYFLDLTGPTLAVDTACSSSLTAVHLACESLRRGECETALAGGVALMLTPRVHIRCSNAGMLSPTGTSAPFDARADGIVLGEGVGVVVLKPLARALADGDHIHGVIKATGVNGDGRTNGMTAPSAAAQTELIRRVHHAAGVTPGDIGYVEAHGTGTPLGDPIEVKALHDAFRTGGDGDGPATPTALGSVKANIGHTTMAAGVAGLLKVLLALWHRQVPPNPHFGTANPEIDLTRGPFHVPTRAHEWRPGRAGTRIAALSSFGFSGTNAHAVVAEAPTPAPERPGRASEAAERPWLIPVSARDQHALERSLNRLADALDTAAGPVPGLADVAFTLGTGRTHFPVRAAFVVRDHEELVRALRAAAAHHEAPYVHPPTGPGGAADAPHTTDGGQHPGTPEEASFPEHLRHLRHLAETYVRGGTVDWAALHPRGSARRVPLPTYPFARDRHWASPARPDPERSSRVPSAEADGPGALCQPVDPVDPVVADHRLAGRPVLPGVASLSLAVRAAARHGITGAVRVSQVQWLRPVEVSARREVRVTTADRPAGALNFEVTTDDGGQVPCVRGRIAPMGEDVAAGRVSVEAVRQRCPSWRPGTGLYPDFAAGGLEYGPAYQALEGVWSGTDEALGVLRAPAAAVGDTTSWPLDPAVLDAALQTLTALVADDGANPLVPFALRALEVVAPLPSEGYAHATRDAAGFTVRVADRDGRECVRFVGVALRPLPADSGPAARPSAATAAPRPAGPEGAGPKTVVLVPTLRDAGPIPNHAGPPATRPSERRATPETVWVFHTAAARPLAGALATALGRSRADAPRPAVVTTLAVPDVDDPGVFDSLGGPPDTVYWLALHDPAEPLPRQGPDPATFGLFRLLKTLLARGAYSRDLTLKVALRGAVADGGHGPAQPHSAGLLGLTRSAAAEYPKWRAGCVELPPEASSPAELAGLLLAEPCAEPLVVLRGGRRLVRKLVPTRPRRHLGADGPFHEGGAYVLVGGTGGIGTVLARHLARTHHARLALVGRRPFDDTIEARLAELSALGGQAVYLRGDIAEPDAARRVMAEARAWAGRVDGVFHSALVLRDRTLAGMDEDTFLEVLAAKTFGLTALADALREEPPGFLVCFSSAISFADAPGQANYAAASTFEDALASHLRDRSFPVTLVNWGFWGSVGAVARAHHVERFATVGIGSLEPAEGMAALTDVLAAGLAQAVVVKGTPQGLALLDTVPADETTTAEEQAVPARALGAAPDQDGAVPRTLADARAAFAELEQVARSLVRQRFPRREHGPGHDPGAAASSTLERWTGRHPEGSAGQRLLAALGDMLRRTGQPLTTGASDGHPAHPANTTAADPAAALVERHPAMDPHVTLLRRCVAALPEVLDGTLPPTGVLFPGGSMDLVEAVYRGQPLSDHYHRLMAAETVAALGRHRSGGDRGGDTERPFRILEIGAGTGAGTAFVLDALDRAVGRTCDTQAPLPFSYTYTDVSSAFLAHGEREFGAGRPYLSCRLLDIERPPAEQGFTSDGYDLVLATNVLHATRDMGRTLRHVRQLLAPGGSVLINEVTRASDFLTLTFGLTPGWWAFEDSERRLPHAPLLGPDQWRGALAESGFGPVRMTGVRGTPVEDLEQCVIVAEASGVASGPAPVPASDDARVRGYVRDVFAEVLKFDPGALADEVTFENYGVDSLVSLRIIGRFEEDFGELPATLLFEKLTIAQLAEYFAAEHGPALTALLHPAGAENTAASGADADADARADAKEGTLADADADTSPQSQSQSTMSAPTRERTFAPSAPSTPPSPSDIAVIGVSGRYPGADDVNEFWHNLATGTASFTEVPAERWDWRPTFDARRGTPQRSYSRWGAFLDGIDQFDPAFFGILGRDAAHIDPQERLFLETAWNLLEENGRLGTDTHEPNTGVFVGSMYGTYGQLAATGWPQGRLSGAHSAHWSLANRVSYFFDFNGPSIAVDSACSSSLTAVHLACESLRRGECRTAVAGGVNLILHPAHHVSLSALNMLSADGRCKVFDAGADGFVPGEGVGAVLLKPLDRAIADGDRIWAVIKGGAMNAGGKTGGYTVPNPNAQAALVRRVLENCSVAPETVSYVECHGTGTALGDPIEIAALGKALDGPRRPHRCAVGSVKSNVGHLEGAAGIAGLTKLLLQLRHGQLAPCVNLDRLNPKIDFGAAALEPVRALTDWPAPPDGGPRRAGVSSFGAGGANTHLVVEEYTGQYGVERRGADGTGPAKTPGPHLFLLSARSAERLRVYAGRVADHLTTPDGAATALDSLARTSQTGRRHFSERLAVVCADTDRLAVLLRSYAETGRAEIPGITVGRAATGQGGGRLGPDSALLRDVREAYGAEATDVAAALGRLGGRWASGDDVDWSVLWAGRTAPRVPYPTYPFDRSRHWLDTGVVDPTLGGPAPGRASTGPAPTTVPVPDGSSAGPAPETTGSAPDTASVIEPAARAAETGPTTLYRLTPVLEARPSDGRATDATPPRRVLLLGPDSAPRRAVAEELTRRGVDCLPVRPGERCAWSEDGVLLPAQATPDDLRRLVEDLAERDRLPDAIVLVCPPTAGPPRPDTLAGDLDAGPYALLWAAAALLARDRRVSLRTVVAHGPAWRQPQFSATGGLLKSLALEHSGLMAVRIAFDAYDEAAGAGGEATANRFATVVADELGQARTGTTELVYDRDGVRHLRRLTERPAPPQAPDAPLPVRAGGTYLVTGGAGALGRILGGFLADTNPVNLVLAGRTPPGEDIERRTAELWRGGSTVWYRQTDLARAADVSGLMADIRARYGGLNGVVHTAGVHRDARAVRKSAGEAAQVLGPKVTGTVLLDQATRDDDLDFYVLCASLVGETGNLGQSDYAYANAFQLDFAESREHLRELGERTGRTVAIGWPLWEDGGMDVDDATRRLFAQLWSMAPLRTDTGLAVFRAALAGTQARWLPVERAAVPAPEDTTPVPPQSAHVPPGTATGTTTDPAAQAGRHQEARTDMATGTPDTTRPATGDQDAVREQLRLFTTEFLMVEPVEVDTAAELMDLGFDSISLSELVVRVNDHYGLELLPTVLFEHPTLDDVAAHLSHAHPAEVRAAHPPRPTASAPATPDTPDGPTMSVPPHTGSVAAASYPGEDVDGPVPDPGDPSGASEPARPNGAPTPGAGPARRRDVAVIGMAGRLPGSPDLDAFWRHLAAGDELVGPVPPDRTDLLDDPATAGLRGGFLTDVADFDAAFFRISPAEARLMDPQHRLFLETVWHTVEDAGYRPEDLAGRSVGVFVGMATSDYGELIAKSGVSTEAHMATGVARSLVANRLSHLLDLRGPSETVDTACSSSLVALHRAVGAVSDGECDEAIAGGVSLTLSPGLFRVFDQSGMLSPGGRCRTFDKDADGYVRGEGVGAVLLKPLDRALADGDRVIAVVRGSAVNHCGKSPSLTAPNPRAQADVVVRAHRVAGIAPGTVTYIETHGTGTRLGDPIEAEGLKDAFTRLYADAGEPVPTEPHITLGSVKTNIGHLEAAAGIAGLLKVLLCMAHRTLPAHLHLREPSPYLRLDGTPLRIGTTTTPWEGAKDEHGRLTWRAGVSSFGFGGTNAHVVLEAWTPPDDAHRPPERVRALPLTEFRPRRHWFGDPDGTRQTRTENPVSHVPQASHTAPTAPDTALTRAPLSAPAPLPAPPVADRPRVRLVPLPGPAVPDASPAPAAPRHDASAARPAAPGTRPGQPPATPHTGTPAPKTALSEAEVRATVRGLVADVLGLGVDDIAYDTPFADLGLDSIFRMDVARALNDLHGLDLQGADLYEHDSIAALAAHVLTSATATATAPRPAPRAIPPTRTPADAPATSARPPAPTGDQARATPGEPPTESTRDDPGTSAQAPENPGQREDAVRALAHLLERVLGRSFDPAVSFEANGFTSFDMLRSVSALESGLGALPKALLFERPTLDQLADALCEMHGEKAVARVRPPAPRNDPPTAPSAPAAPDAARQAGLVTRVEAAADPELGPVLKELEREYGKESGLGGRDIAPHLFVGAERRGFFALSRRGPAMLVWNYTGPEDHFAELAAEYFDHARRNGLEPNLLSLVRLENVGGSPVTATPFGALQRIEDVGSFKLSGGRMSRLRYMVKRFEKAGTCRTTEYRSGEDPAVDAELARLVDGWSATKQMVNPYVRRVRDELAGGRLDERHRLFLTYLDDALVNAVVITRIPSENGHLLDVEFYPDHMPLGGLEFALVRILERLRAEGCEVFSFGASFGGEMGASPNASETAVRALAELRDAGIFGGGNYQFKNKFRPENRTLYLVQPEGEDATAVSDVILMIADPAAPVTGTAAPGDQPAGAENPGTENPGVQPAGTENPGTESPRVATNGAEPPDTPPAGAEHTGAERTARLARLAAHGHNPVRLPHVGVGLDLITDSWADRADPWQRERTRELAELADATGVTGEEPPALPWLPFAHRFFAASGRAAEERLCRAWPGPRGRVLHNSAFPTWLATLVEQGFDPSVTLPVVGEGPFAADLDLAALEEALDRHAGEISFVLVETATNAHGGAPLSPENLRDVTDRARARGVPLVLDATRLLDNALLAAAASVTSHRDLWQIAAEMLGAAQAVTFSLSKDFGVDGGGLVATVDERLAERLRERMLERGREPGLPARRLLSAALADAASTERLVTERVANVAAFRQRLELGGVPLVPGPTAHCVLLDVDKLAPGTALRHPVASYLAGIYEACGVRGGPHLGTGGRHPDGSTPRERHLIRLAVPVGLDRATLERAADQLAELVADPASVRDLTEVPGAPGPAALRAYHPTDALPADIRQALQDQPAAPAPASENHAVLRERAPGTRRHLLPMTGGAVEVFDRGTGPAVLMLPPFNMGAGVFADQVAGLSDRYRVLVVHHPGVGATTSAEDISLPGIADLYRQTLDRLGVTGPVHVVGTSFGGLLAQSFVLAHPERAASLALVCSSYKYANRAGEVNRLEDLVAEDLDRVIAAGAADVATRRAEYAARLLRCESMAPHIGLRYLDVFAQQPDLLGRLGDIAVPTLVVAGAVDAVVPRKTSHLMHGAIPDARYHELPLGGHFPTVTDPDGVTAALTAFLADCATAEEQR